MDDAAERVAVGFAEAERLRRSNVPGADVIEFDGLLLAFANVADPELNSALVVREPFDVPRSLDRARAEFARRGLRLGLDIQAGRHPSVDSRVRSDGMGRILDRPGMVARVADLSRADPPAGVQIVRARAPGDKLAAARVAGEAFGDTERVVTSFYAKSVPDVPEAVCLTAAESGRQIGSVAGYLHEGAVGILGLGVPAAARGRGVGAALTVAAARAFTGADLAWLHPASPEARSLYERLGFRAVADWEVWVDPA